MIFPVTFFRTFRLTLKIGKNEECSFINTSCLPVVIFSRAQNIVYDENAEVRTVEKFTGIEVSGAVSVYLSQGPEQGVAVSAGEEKYNNKIKTEVKNGVLHISVDGGVWNGFNWTNRKLKAYVTATDLNRLQVSGASYVSISGNDKKRRIKNGYFGSQ